MLNIIGLLDRLSAGSYGLEGREVARLTENELTDAVARVPGVIAAGRTNLGIDSGMSRSSFARVDGNPQLINMGTYNVDIGFFAAMGTTPRAGRVFDRAKPRDDAHVSAADEASDAEQAAFAARGTNTVINQAAVGKFGFASAGDAVGKTVRVTMVDEKFGLVPVTIIGVVPDLQMRSVREPVEPRMYFYDGSQLTDIMVRVKADEAGAVRDRIQKVWKHYAAQVLFDGRFADEIVRAQYDADEACAKLFAGFAGLAIFVACLGLYGLAAFTAERRTREIGIRKALGARNRDIVSLLVWQFSRPVLIANLIAWPVAWWLMRDWLDTFAQRIDLGLQWFVLAGVLAAGIAAATIIGHAFKVARQSPALALRYE